MSNFFDKQQAIIFYLYSQSSKKHPVVIKKIVLSMSPGNATYPCQYIYFIFVTLPTEKDGDVFCFLAIDGFSRYCFPPTLTVSPSNKFILQHIDAVLAEIDKTKPGVKPTLVMGYGDDIWKELTSRFEHVNLIYDPETAYKIALPVVEEIVSTGLPQK